MAIDASFKDEIHEKFAHRHRGILFPLLLITVGILLLFNNAGLVPWSVWQEVWRFWPMLLILLGLQIMIGHSWISDVIIGLLGLLFGVFIILYALHSGDMLHNQTIDMFFSQMPQFNQQTVWPQ